MAYGIQGFSLAMPPWRYFGNYFKFFALVWNTTSLKSFPAIYTANSLFLFFIHNKEKEIWKENNSKVKKKELWTE